MKQGSVLLGQEHDHRLARVAAGARADARKAAQDRLHERAFLLVSHVTREIRQLGAEFSAQTVALRYGLDTAESGIGSGRHLAPDFEPGVVTVQGFGGTGAAGDGLGRFVEGEDQP